MAPEPGDLVRLTSTKGAVSEGLLVEAKLSHGVQIWRVLLPEGLYSHIREEGWDIEAISEKG
jgi:hypothetical protein